MVRSYNYEISKEENVAYAIFDIVKDYEFGKLRFEISDDLENKNVLFSYVLKPITDIQTIERHLKGLRIKKEFNGVRNSERKQYLAVIK